MDNAQCTTNYFQLIKQSPLIIFMYFLLDITIQIAKFVLLAGPKGMFIICLKSGFTIYPYSFLEKH